MMSKGKTKILDISLLYVEDEPDIREAISETLKRRVKTLYLAENGKEGLELFLSKSPDIIVTDIKMPVMDGLEMAEKIKQHNPKIPIILATAHEDKDFFHKAIAIGIQSYVVKPIDLRKLREAIESYAEKIELEKIVNEQMECIKSLINLQDDIIVMIESSYLHLVNKAFLEFFGFESAEDFNSKYTSILDFLHEKKEYVYKPKENQSNWLETLLNNGKSEGGNILENKVGDNPEFIVRFESLPGTNKFIVIMKRSE